VFEVDLRFLTYGTRCCDLSPILSIELKGKNWMKVG